MWWPAYKLTTLISVGFIIVFLTIIFLVLHQYRKWRYFSSIGINCAIKWPILGVLPSIKMNGVLKTDVDGIRENGNLYGTYLGNIPTLVVTDTDMIKEIFIRQFNNFQHRMKALYISKWWENGVVIASGDHWKYLRSLLTPSFSYGKVKKTQSTVSECLNKLESKLHAMCNENSDTVLDMRKVFGALTMDLICRISFGVKLNPLSDIDDEFARRAKIVSTLNIDSSCVNALPLIIPQTKCIFEYFDIDYVDRESLQYIKAVVKQIIDERKRNTSDHFNDTLQYMMNAHTDENVKKNQSNFHWWFSKSSKTRKLTDDELAANSLIILMAGFDTTATTVTWMAYLLATNQNIQNELIYIIDDEIGSSEPTFENISNMEYLDMFLSETLRLYPAANRTGREAEIDTKVCGYNIPKGLSITVPIYALHRMPEYWENPEKCIPERFSKENKHNIKPYSYIPFGVGPRACIGMKMAEMICKIIVVKVLQKFRLEVTQNQEIPPQLEESLLTKPVNGMELKLVPRT